MTPETQPKSPPSRLPPHLKELTRRGMSLLKDLETLRRYRANWEGSGEIFQDPASIFRTAEGHRLYREWAGLWGL